MQVPIVAPSPIVEKHSVAFAVLFENCCHSLSIFNASLSDRVDLLDTKKV